MGNELVVSNQTLRGVLSADPVVKRDALVVLRAQPVQALQLLRNPAAVGLSAQAAANVLDEVASVLPAEEAAAVMEQNLTSERLAELLAERGDLGSTAALLADRKTVLLAMANDFADEPLEQVASTLSAWAHKLKDRADWNKMLDMRLGSHTLRWYLLTYIWNMSGQPGLAERGGVATDDEDLEEGQETLEDMNLDQFEEVGLDVEDSMTRLTGMIQSGQMVRWAAAGLREMTRQFLVRQRELATLPIAAAGVSAVPVELSGLLVAEPADDLASEIGDELQ